MRLGSLVEDDWTAPYRWPTFRGMVGPCFSSRTLFSTSSVSLSSSPAESTGLLGFLSRCPTFPSLCLPFSFLWRGSLQEEEEGSRVMSAVFVFQKTTPCICPETLTLLTLCSLSLGSEPTHRFRVEMMLLSHEQQTSSIISTLNRCVGSLPRDKLQRVSRVSVSGQMHGVVFWKTNTDYFVAKDTSQLITWQDGRCSADFLSSLPPPDSHLALASGFGCATIFWYSRNRPEFLGDWGVAGTIQDYVVSMLCGLDGCVMTPHNAASWGFFNTTSGRWNTRMWASRWGCSPGVWWWRGRGGAHRGRVARRPRPHAVLNISTSAQLAYTMPGGFRPPDAPVTGSPISYFPYFDESYLAVAASLNGGNALTTFVGGGDDDSWLYDKLIGCALCQPHSDLTVTPTLLGERHHHPPLRGAAAANLSAGNLSLGHVTRALCRGVLDNLSAMMPTALLREAGVRRVRGSGSALARNPVLQAEAERALHPLTLEYGHAADSAVGAAMVACDRLSLKLTILDSASDSGAF
ncbi:hypothetical protein CRUP_001286 [Coryphaenoides rupestris]|nr:hypothetical protein CRUP_001286 [Coryphaenoides rupestris]